MISSICHSCTKETLNTTNGDPTTTSCSLILQCCEQERHTQAASANALADHNIQPGVGIFKQLTSRGDKYAQATWHGQCCKIVRIGVGKPWGVQASRLQWALNRQAHEMTKYSFAHPLTLRGEQPEPSSFLNDFSGNEERVLRRCWPF